MFRLRSLQAPLYRPALALLYRPHNPPVPVFLLVFLLLFRHQPVHLNPLVPQRRLAKVLVRQYPPQSHPVSHLVFPLALAHR